MTRKDLALLWISYAVGIVLGRFEPGVEGGLGRGRFSPPISERLRKLADRDGILVQDEGHPEDLAPRTLEALTVMLGEEDAQAVVREATGGDGPAEEVLRKFLERGFWKEHLKRYRKRPVYWLLQSPGKSYGVWLFHERMTPDTLFRIQREYVDPKVKLLENRLKDLRSAGDAAEGRERRRIEKSMAPIEEALEDVRDLSRRLKAVIDRGYTPHIDDGVLLNMAPFWELVPSWQAEPRNAWNALEEGEYDWSHQAMDFWPERVKEKCKTNRSYAIAHGLVE